MNKIINNNTFTESYIELIKSLCSLGVTKKPHNVGIAHIQNCLFSVNSPGDIFDHPLRKFNANYLNKELELYLDGKLSAIEFSEASKFWLHLANPDGNINSNYGYRIFYKPIDNKFNKTFKNQWEFAKQQLLDDKDSRQSLIFVSGQDVQFNGNKDFICTLNYIFNIEDNKLHMTVQRRSQDIHFGLPYDYCFEYLLMVKMLSELQKKYPEVTLGSYTMFANNIHLYERNFELYNNILNDINSSSSLQINNLILENNIKKLATI